MPAAIALMFLFASVIMIWPQYGWPYWPVLMGVSAALTLWGLHTNSWRAPFAVLLGYVAMRGVIWGLEPAAYEVGAFLVWAIVAIQLYRVKAWIPGTAYLCSGAVYPALVLLEFRLVYHGLAPIIAEMFALAALISMSGGLYERSRNYRESNNGQRNIGFGSIWSNISLGLAPNVARN